MFLPTDPATYLTPAAFITLIIALIQIYQNRIDLKKRQREIDQKIYETLVFGELGERIGYELNITRILDIIVDSLGKLLSFSAVSYMISTEDQAKVNWRVHLEETVNQAFIGTMKKYMLESLNRVAARQFSEDDVQMMLTGTIRSEEAKEPVASLWITPIIINTRGVGILAVASQTPGLYRGSEMDVLTKILDQANRAVNNLETVIATEQQKIRSMVTSMADGILMFDQNFNILVINPAAEKLLGLPVGSTPTIFDIARTLADKFDLRAKLEQSIKEDRLVSLDNLVVGDKISQLLISPVKDSRGHLQGTVVIFHDRSAERQLEQIREDFTAMMVHELRAPLTVVRGAADMFLKDPSMASQSQGQELIKTMRTSSSAMLSLVDDLLDVAKIESGKFQILKSAGNLVDIVSDRVAFFTPLAAAKSITIRKEVAQSDLSLDFDRDRIIQVLNNLISNAVKFTPPGGIVTISAYKINSPAEIKWRFGLPVNITFDRPQALVAISDTGQGIPPEKVAELFSKFKQLHAAGVASDGMAGTGLGLVIAKGIIESHQGKIFLESRTGEGSTFYFTLPETVSRP